MKTTLLFLFLSLSSLIAQASFTFNDDCKTIYRQIINLQIKEAKIGIAAEQKKNPDNKITILLENYIDFIGVITGETEADLEKLTSARNSRLQAIAAADSDSPWFFHSQGIIYLQNAMAKMMFNEKISSGMDFSNAFNLIKKNNEKYTSFTPSKAVLGFMQAVAGTIPDDFRWLLKPFSIEGTVQQGLSNIRSSYASSANSAFSFLRPEYAFIYSFLAVNVANDKKLAAELAADFKREPLSTYVKSSQLIRFAFVNMLMKLGRNDEAIEVLQQPTLTKATYQLNSLNYQLGVCKLNRQDKDAHIYLLKFTGSSRGVNYIRTAYERLAWYYLLRNDTTNYSFYMKRILIRGKNIIDSDKQAFDHATAKYKPESGLLSARLYFDGGYYENALDALRNWKMQNLTPAGDLHLEYIYRTARIYDYSGRKNEAISWYKETILLGEKTGSYLPVNAALQLGLLFEQKGDLKSAGSYFEKVLSMNPDEYRFSIRQKAKAGLNRLANP